MYYKEFLRVRHALFILSIVLAALVVIQLIVNLATEGVLVATVTKPPSDPHTWSVFFVASGIVATIIAGIFAAALGSENDGHLEQAWTKPASRVRYAMNLFAVDIAGVLAAWVLSFVAHVFIHYLDGTLRFVLVDKAAWPALALYLMLPIGWYGLVVALTASLRASSKTVAGLSSLAALILLGLSYARLPDLWATLLRLVNLANPLVYASYSLRGQSPAPFAAWQADAAALVAIGIIGASVGLLQWRRLEA
jgi:hypothetical protein